MLIDFHYAIERIKESEKAIDAMAKSLKVNIKDEDMKTLAVLYKASSYLYCAHSTLLEVKDQR